MSSRAPYSVTAAAGLPETELPNALVDLLPPSVAGAPWRTRCRVATWMHQVDESALDAFPKVIRPDGIALVAWALVRYEHTPVGPYDEIAATLIPDGGDGYGHIPFIAVDSYPSIVGGRTNWLLPKSLARFVWSKDNLSANVTADAPAKPGWSINVTVWPTGEATKQKIPNQVQQVSVDGEVRRFDGQIAGSMQAATVTVDGVAEGPLSTLMVSGSYAGTVLSDCKFEVGALNPV